MSMVTQSIKIRYFTAYGVTVVVLWGAIAYALHSVQREAIDRASIEGGNLARSLAEHQASSVRAIDQSLLHLRAEWANGAKNFATHVARQQEYLKGERVTHVGIMGANGWAAWSSRPGWRSADVSDRPYFKAHKESGTDELIISAPVLGRVSKQWAIQFTRSIYDRHQQFAGVILFSVPPPALEQVYNDIDLGERGIIALARSDGQMLAHSRSLAEAAKISFADSQALKPDSPAYGHFRRQARTDGVDRLYAYHKVSGYPLTVFVGQAADRVFAPYYAQRATYLASGTAATALLLAFTLLLISRRRNKEDIDRDHAQLAAIVQCSSDGIVGLDLDGTVQSWNAGAEHLSGLTAVEAVGRKAAALINLPDQAEEIRKVRERIDRGESAPPFDTMRVAKDGRRIDVSISMSPVKDLHGKVIGISAIVRNISERKRAEHEAALALDRLRFLAETARVYAWSWDIETDDLTYLSSPELLLGPCPADGKYPAFRDMVHPEERAAFIDLSRRAVTELREYEREFRVVRTDGEVRWLMGRGKAYSDASRRATTLAGVTVDITERKRAEEQVRKLNEELEQRVGERTAELTAAIGALQTENKERQLAEASALRLADRLQDMARRLGEAQEVERRRLSAELHDGVCSNLAAIGLNLVILQKQLAAADAHGMERRLSDLIAQVDEAKANAKDISVDLRPLLENDRDLLSALGDYGRKFEASTGIAVEVRGAGSGRRLQAEEKVALFRITQEALTNCAKHAQTKTVAIELNTEMDHSVLSISDDGVGFDFTGVSGKKSGLGLLSMQERAEAIGGLWRVESTPGSGTRVIVKIGAAALA